MVEVLEEVKRTKKELLKNWMRQKHVFATHEVIHWGDTNFYNRSAQTKGDLIKEGFITRLDNAEKNARGYHCKDEVYICNEY